MKTIKSVQMKADPLSNISEHQPTTNPEHPWIKTPAERQKCVLRKKSGKNLPGYYANKFDCKTYRNTFVESALTANSEEDLSELIAEDAKKKSCDDTDKQTKGTTVTVSQKTHNCKPVK
jgi:hypothetical protein